MSPPPEKWTLNQVLSLQTSGFRSGHPASSVNEENIAAVKKLLETDGHITYHQIEESLDIPASAIHSILYNHLKVSKVCSLWVHHSSTVEQMNQCV
ncbi:hypothetical protein LAZ67_13002528 [Cordylochernes scorpioides]|uniref:Uncharacterized protein n=1 Tax=Cordylochernes scorpioides TaxID=51811 RepID=A0ABY6L537_9ARAC|nr:hypothetical protein LAZ67_13002528 [Cordylochernes scorpioides]